MRVKQVKPFLKWAGGKAQLIDDIKSKLPADIISKPFTYVEPFVGGGAVLFWVLNNCSNVKRVIINDINEDLINTYKVIASNPKELISVLDIFQNEYSELENYLEEKKEYYYQKRDLYNLRKENTVVQAALFIFLNKTCFNGLYRVNRRNEYNVPIGSYKSPLICDKENIFAGSEAMQKVEIICGDFEATSVYAASDAIFYLDPPYKPLSQTSNFNSYSKDDFGDNDQIRLRNFCSKIDRLNSFWILSNSDVNGNNIGDNFFDELYSKYNITRVNAKRMINKDPDRRGILTELLITNK